MTNPVFADQPTSEADRLNYILDRPVHRNKKVNNVLLIKYVLEPDHLSEEQKSLISKEIAEDRQLRRKYLSIKKQKCFLEGRQTSLSDD